MSATTGNNVMAQIASACECVGLELLNDGIYHQDKKLVEFVYGNGQYYYVQLLEEQPSPLCGVVDLLDMPIGQLTPEQREMLFETGEEQAA